MGGGWGVGGRISRLGFGGTEVGDLWIMVPWS